MFDKLYADGVMRWEIRTSLSTVYDLHTEYTSIDAMNFILDVYTQWQDEDITGHRDHFTFGIIIQGMRDGTDEEVKDALVSAYKLREIFPEYIVGFDLVGHEDPGKTLLYWSKLLIETENILLHEYQHNTTTTNSNSNTTNTKMPFLFHAAESNRIAVQENIVDAVFLNSTRIGHGKCNL